MINKNNNQKNSPRIILVDLDGTLTHDICWTPKDCLNARPNKKAIDKIWECFKGDFLVIYTARKDKLIPATLRWLRESNVYFNAISNIKAPADIYIDDKCINIKDLIKNGKKRRQRKQKK